MYIMGMQINELPISAVYLHRTVKAAVNSQRALVQTLCCRLLGYQRQHPSTRYSTHKITVLLDGSDGLMSDFSNPSFRTASIKPSCQTLISPDSSWPYEERICHVYNKMMARGTP